MSAGITSLFFGLPQAFVDCFRCFQYTRSYSLIFRHGRRAIRSFSTSLKALPLAWAYDGVPQSIRVPIYLAFFAIVTFGVLLTYAIGSVRACAMTMSSLTDRSETKVPVCF